MTRWRADATQDLYDLAWSDPPASGKVAGELYEMAAHLGPSRAGTLNRLRNNVADIRYWDLGRYSIYFRVDGRKAYTVLHVAEVTGALRVKSNRIAISRA